MRSSVQTLVNRASGETLPPILDFTQRSLPGRSGPVPFIPPLALSTRFPYPMRRILTSISRVSFIALVAALCAPLAFAQMPQGGGPAPISSSEVSDAQLQKVVQVLMEVRSATRSDRMQMRKDMKEMQSQEMDSTQKAQARKKMRQRQMALRKKQQKIMQKKVKEVNMDPKMFRRIMRSMRKDPELQKRLKAAMQEQMKQRQSQMGGSGQQGGGSNR